MKFFYQLVLNIVFFAIYGIVGSRIVSRTSYAALLEPDGSLVWGKFAFAVFFFIVVALFAIASSYAVLAGAKASPMKKGIALDDTNIEVTPEFVVDGKEETPESLIDIVADKSGKIFKDPPKNKIKKNIKKKK